MNMLLPSETTIQAIAGIVSGGHKAAVSLRRNLVADIENLRYDFSQIIDVAVSFYGTWHHGGLKFSHV